MQRAPLLILIVAFLVEIITSEPCKDTFQCVDKHNYQYCKNDENGKAVLTGSHFPCPFNKICDDSKKFSTELCVVDILVGLIPQITATSRPISHHTCNGVGRFGAKLCNQYYNCQRVSEMPTLRTCPQGKSFDSAAGDCVKSELFDCKSTTVTTTTTPTTTTTSTTVPTTTFTTTTSITTTTPVAYTTSTTTATPTTTISPTTTTTTTFPTTVTTPTTNTTTTTPTVNTTFTTIPTATTTSISTTITTVTPTTSAITTTTTIATTTTIPSTITTPSTTTTPTTTTTSPTTPTKEKSCRIVTAIIGMHLCPPGQVFDQLPLKCVSETSVPDGRRFTCTQQGKFPTFRIDYYVTCLYYLDKWMQILEYCSPFQMFDASVQHCVQLSGLAKTVKLPSCPGTFRTPTHLENYYYECCPNCTEAVLRRCLPIYVFDKELGRCVCIG